MTIELTEQERTQLKDWIRNFDSYHDIDHQDPFDTTDYECLRLLGSCIIDIIRDKL